MRGHALLGAVLLLAVFGIAGVPAAQQYPTPNQPLPNAVTRPTPALPPALPALSPVTPQLRSQAALRLIGKVPGLAPTVTGTVAVTPQTPASASGEVYLSAGGNIAWFSGSSPQIRVQGWLGPAGVSVSFRAAASTRYLMICDLNRANWTVRLLGVDEDPYRGRDMPLTWEGERLVFLVAARSRAGEMTMQLGALERQDPTQELEGVLRRCEVSAIR